jgi:predicted metallo-beta-lactamase superfamily hydrolase
MKLFLIAALTLSVAAPVAVTVVPTTADAQVLAGRGAARAAARNSRPPLSERELDRLYAAQDEVMSLTQQVEDIQISGQEQGGLTPEQTAQIEAHQTRIAEQQAIVDRLEAKRARRD